MTKSAPPQPPVTLGVTDIAAMIARATGLDAEEVLGLPVDDVIALMSALGDLSAAVADRVEAAVARTSVPRTELH